MTIVLLLVTLVGLVAVIYAHLRLPYHSASAAQRRMTRVVLIGVGLLFGAVMSYMFSRGGTVAGQAALPGWLVFASAFGLTHIPAAGILFLKRQQRRA